TATAATVTASIVTIATGTDRRWRGTVRDPRTGAPTASVSRRELQPGALPGRFAGQTGDSLPASISRCQMPDRRAGNSPPAVFSVSRRYRVPRPNARGRGWPNHTCFFFDTSARSNLT
ncbi:hypothetical protein, partial [Burkholderia cenocepacia]|uniref:hypothetical protein n=1 Tax=Burkholderia cenocepacia TaxID=95486 RepID=UPI001E2A17F3